MRCNCNYVPSLKNPSFTKTIARDCRYGEVCNGQQRCEVGSGSSVSIQDGLSARFFEEALRRSRRVKRDIDGWQGWEGLLFVWPKDEIWYKVLLSVWYPRKNTCYTISLQTENDSKKLSENIILNLYASYFSWYLTVIRVGRRNSQFVKVVGRRRGFLLIRTKRGPLGEETDYNFAHS